LNELLDELRGQEEKEPLKRRRTAGKKSHGKKYIGDGNDTDNAEGGDEEAG
jgi:hypothetical protein